MNEEILMQDWDDSEIRVLENVVHYPHEIWQYVWFRVERGHQYRNITCALVVRYHQRPLVYYLFYVVSLLDHW